MPVLASFGPTRSHPFMPAPSGAGELSAAARRYGVLPLPPLEWNAQVERETAHLYERV
ncbi:MAG: quinolinate synthase, partial [Hyphomicrobiales bacterium]|nr:quinolinate synthase [Hyphomicrobiales bacterium]